MENLASLGNFTCFHTFFSLQSGTITVIYLNNWLQRSGENWIILTVNYIICGEKRWNHLHQKQTQALICAINWASESRTNWEDDPFRTFFFLPLKPLLAAEHQLFSGL